MTGIAFLSMAVALAGVGYWGNRAASVAGLPGDKAVQEQKRRVLRRGSRTCWVISALFGGAAVMGWVINPLG